MNLFNLPILSIVTFMPLLGVLVILLPRPGMDSDKNIRAIALVTTIVTFVTSLPLWLNFDNSRSGFQFVERYNWISDNVSYHLGIDGLSVLLIILTTFLMPICILASAAIHMRVKEYMIAFLVLETLMIGVFCSLDLLLFYIFFEAGLIPMFLIIGIWGGPRRIYATFKFFLFTLLGSLLMLLAIVYLYWQTGTTDIVLLLQQDIPINTQTWLWLALFASFAVKIPMWPVHTWLPDAHVEAPTAGSVILAGVLLKMGAYGFLRFSLLMLPVASHKFAPLIYTLSIIAIIYTSLVALVQTDMKKLIAYSSIAHMGYITLGLFTFTQQGIEGAILQMISHGLVSGALFLCVGVVYDRLHTRDIIRYGGLAANMPRYAVVFMIFTLATIGLPGTSGFVGEFLILLGAYQTSTVIASLAATGVVLGAVYSLYLYRRIIFGTIIHEDLKNMTDLSTRERLMFLPLIATVLWIGIYPSSFINPISATVKQLVSDIESKTLRQVETNSLVLNKGLVNHE